MQIWGAVLYVFEVFSDIKKNIWYQSFVFLISKKKFDIKKYFLFLSKIWNQKIIFVLYQKIEFFWSNFFNIRKWFLTSENKIFIKLLSTKNVILCIVLITQYFTFKFWQNTKNTHINHSKLILKMENGFLYGHKCLKFDPERAGKVPDLWFRSMQLVSWFNYMITSD